ncbi:MAG: hypothetical protein FJ272_13230, partial [Planctomycetes bacterium]|nr:hypothetical protein [Planctomycetota bacterium]
MECWRTGVLGCWGAGALGSWGGGALTLPALSRQTAESVFGPGFSSTSAENAPSLSHGASEGWSLTVSTTIAFGSPVPSTFSLALWV